MTYFPDAVDEGGGDAAPLTVAQVEDEFLERILQLAQDIIDGKIEEKPYEHSFFKGKMCAYRDELGIVYPKFDRK